MTIPHRIRGMAREGYRHMMFTGQRQVFCANTVTTRHDNTMVVVDLIKGTEYHVPIAASWL